MKNFLIVFFLIISFCSAGQLLFWDFGMDYTNVGYTSHYTFSFSLETSIKSSDFLKLSMPYSLHSTTVNNQPGNLQANLSTLSSCAPSQIYIATIYSYSSGVYYLKFNDLQGNSQGLQSGIVFSLDIFLFGTLPTPSVGLYSQPVALSTVSSTLDSAIVYDENSFFTTIAHTAAPNALVSALVNIKDPLINTLSSQYPVYMTVSFLESVTISSRLFVYMTEASFLFTGSCSLVSGMDVFGNLVAALNENQYNCQVDTANNMLKLKLSVDVTANLFKIQLKFFVINPAKVINSGYFKIRVLYAYSNHIVNEKTLTDYTLKTVPINIDSSRMSLAWNLPYLANMAPSKSLSLIRGDANPPTSAYIYNAVRFYFKIKRNTPDNIQLQVDLNLITDDSGSQSSYVLEGSIIENLPGYLLSPPNCYITNNNQDSSTIRHLICDNVGKLSTGFEYFIGFRIFLQYDAASADLNAAFSTLNIYTRQGSSLDANPIIGPTVLASSISTTNNKNWLISTLENTVVTSQSLSWSSLVKPEVSSGFMGVNYISTKDPQRLLFNLNVPAAEATQTTIVSGTNAAITDSAGLYIIMNPMISLSDTTVLENTVADISGCGVSIEKNGSSINPDRKTIIKITATGTVALENMYANSQYNRFSIKEAIISSPASFYGDDYLMDFFFYSYDNILSTTPVFQGVFMINAYTISSPKPNYLYFSMVNYYTGSTVINDGTFVPTFIRIYGFIRQSDLNNLQCQRLALFFDNGLSFYKNSDSSLDKSIGCSSSSPATCYGFSNERTISGQLAINFNRVEVQFTNGNVPTETANAFQLIIPVKTVSTIYKIRLFIAGMQTSTVLSSRYYQPVVYYRLTGDSSLLNTNQLLDFSSTYSGNTVALSATTLLVWGLSNPNYGFLFTSDSIVGTIQSLMTIEASHTDASDVITQNLNLPSISSNGAGFTMSLPWKFFNNNTVYNWQHSGVSMAEQCVNFNYNRDVSTNDMRYGVFCPLQKGQPSSDTVLNVSIFLFDNTEGTYLPDYTCFAYSKNSGTLATLVTASTGSALVNSGKISTEGILVTPLILRLYEKEIRLKWNITTQNPLYNDMKVIISFNSTLIFTPGSRCVLQKDSSTISDVTCASTRPSASSIQFTISCVSCPLAAGTYIIIHDGNTGPTVSSADSSGNLIIGIETRLSNNNLMDSTAGTTFGSYVFTYNYNVAVQDSLILVQGPSFSSLFLSSRTNISFVFQTNARGVYQSEVFVLDLGWFSEINAGNTALSCEILSTSQEKDHRFSVLSTVSLVNIAITAKEDIPKGTSFLFACNEVIVPNELPVTSNLSLALKDSTMAIFIQTAVEIPVFDSQVSNSLQLTASESLSVQKNWTSNGFSKGNIVFSLSVAQSLAKNTKVYLSFPKYYLPGLVGDGTPISCELNSVEIACYLFRTRTVLLTLNSDISAGNAVIMTINGVVLVENTVTLGKFYLSLQKNYQILKYATVSDYFTIETSSSTGNAQNFVVYNMSVANGYNFIKQTSNYTLDLLLSSLAIVENNILIVDFPYEWNYLLDNSNIFCSLLGTDGANLTKNSQFLYSNRVKITISSTISSSVESFSHYKLIVSSIKNPNSLICLSQNPTISIYSSSSILLYYSAYNTKNIPKFTLFSVNSQQIYLDFSFSTQFLQIKPGTISFPIFFVNMNSSSAPLQIDLIAQSGISLINSPITLYSISNQSTAFQLGASVNILPGIYLINFAKIADPYGKFADLPVLKLLIQEEYSQIYVENSASLYEIPYISSGTSLPIIISLSESPAQVLSLTVSFENTGFNLTFATGSTQQVIEFSSNGPLKNSFIVINKETYSNYSLIGQNTRILFTVNEPLNETYAAPQPISVGLVEDMTEIASFLLEIDENNVFANNANLILSCDENGIIYFTVSLVEALSESYETIRTKALNYTQYAGVSDLDQRQYSFIIVNSSNIGYNVTYNVQNLLANFSYKVLGFCVNQAQLMSISIMRTFTTKDNGGYVRRLSLEYGIPLNMSQKTRLLCYFVNYFGLAIENVKTKDGLQCKNITDTSLPTNLGENSVETSTTTTQDIYFLPELLSSSDATKTKIYAILNNDLTYLFYSLQKDLQSLLPSLTMISSAETLYPFVPEFDPSHDITITFDYDSSNNNTYINIQGLSLLANNGFIYVAAVENNQSFYMDFYALRTGNGGQGKYYMDYVVNGQTFAYNFTGLKNNTVYQVFYAASDENPGYFPNYNSVSSVSINTTFALTSAGERIGGYLICGIVVVFYMIGIIFMF